MKERRGAGAQLVQEIRKQAEDVMYLCLYFGPPNFLKRWFLSTLLCNLVGETLHEWLFYHMFQARDYAITMPYRVQRIEEFVKQLESGDLKLRVRVLEVSCFRIILGVLDRSQFDMLNNHCNYHSRDDQKNQL